MLEAKIDALIIMLDSAGIISSEKLNRLARQIHATNNHPYSESSIDKQIEQVRQLKEFLAQIQEYS